MFYFTYGHNMNHDQMRSICPGAKFLRPVALIGHAFFFDGYSTRWDGAAANIDNSMDDEVWGGLFEITPDDLKNIDFDEGHPRYCKRKVVKVGDADAKARVEAWVYHREAQPMGMPGRLYLEKILKGAKDCHLPEDYIQRNFAHYMKVHGL
ncbi:MAG: gamma-glutamylcyclotransferase [Candidatus Omnitrophica bacterium]|nr:gamma-glutamylcyclotransferase [Candidatus Omnitrophota bacterium]